jgi:FMN reductase
MESIKVLGLGGSQRDISRTEHAIGVALKGAEMAGAETELFALRNHVLPLYDDRRDITSYPDSVHQLLKAVRWADSLIIGTPVYHGTMTGGVKNALDFLELMARDESPWLAGKFAGLIGVAGGSSGQNAVNGLLHTCHTLKAIVVPTMAIIPSSNFNGESKINTQDLIERLRRIGQEAVELASRWKLGIAKNQS